ncbi:3-dehydroquinate synthase II [Spongisporangium articulatum]|uniref:3-dehydroquinate synthase II n=1 Tax=Spongisporangium articulatum TaxID=3362603 RepID=A0ABW8AN16_9ACTN
MSTVKDESTQVHAWFDTATLGKGKGGDAFLGRVLGAGYTAVVLYPATAERYVGRLPGDVTRVLHVADKAELQGVLEAGLIPQGDDRRKWVVSSEQTKVLQQAAQDGIATCLRMSAHDQDSLKAAIELGRAHRFLAMRFPDPTNIPLELVIASLQASHTIVIKEITDPKDSEDAVVALGVMEVGSDGVLFSPDDDDDALNEFAAALKEASDPRIAISVATVIRSVPIGMGHRACIDLATLFEPTEGMLIGSTSQGGVLCCPEVFYLPYMELRPFRVNAGGVHSYVYAGNNRTNYLSELKGGWPATVVGLDGRTREVPVGRSKIEIRPLRLIEVEFEGGERVNVIMQDDWHVRVYSAEGQPANVTELKPGDKVLGHVSTPGRHVGLPVDETIEEY